MVQYSQNRVDNIHDLQTKYDFSSRMSIWYQSIRLADFGQQIGIRILDLFFLRNGKDKREVRLTPMLVFIQKVFWKVNEKIEGNSFFFIHYQILVSIQSWSG